MIRKTILYISSIAEEAKKLTLPQKKEVYFSSISLIVIVSSFVLLISISDFVIGIFIKNIFGIN